MPIKKLFPYAIGVCIALSMMSIATLAQTVEMRQRLVTRSIEPSALPILENEMVVVSLGAAEETRVDLPEGSNYVMVDVAANFKYEQMIYAAIDQRLGARYVWGAAGPSAYDCSGFVWSTFKSAGVDFERSSTRSLWARFAPPTRDEKFKFGTLVFFRGLKHIGIVADERGFYHASRSNGVVYSPFNDYWLSRVDGFRRVPLPASPQTEQITRLTPPKTEVPSEAELN